MADIPEPVRRIQIGCQLRACFDMTLPRRVDRHMAVAHQGIIPNRYFAPASSECIKLYTDGYFLSTVMVSQAVAEGIRKFVVERNGTKIDDGNDISMATGAPASKGAVRKAWADACAQIWRWFRRKPRNHRAGPDIVALLVRKSIISKDCGDAFNRIYNSYRNDLHHMNRNIVKIRFAALAKKNIDDLAIIESEMFAVENTERGIRLLKPLYWDLKADGTVDSFLRYAP